MSRVSMHTLALAVGGRRVQLRTNCPRFAQVAAGVFEDLVEPGAADAGGAAGAHGCSPAVVLQVDRGDGADDHWAVRRDGEPCELDLRPDHVLFHVQWELNRLVIEHHPASLHAAAVLTAGGGAVVMAGPSHSGKTTLAGWLAAHHGLVPLADEVVVLDAEGRAAPYRRPFGVRADSPLAAHAPARAGAAAAFMVDEHLVPMGHLAAAVAHHPSPVVALVFPERSPAATRPVVEHVSPADALVRLAAGTPGLHTHGGPVFHRLAGVVRRAPALRLHYADVATAAPLLLHTLASPG